MEFNKLLIVIPTRNRASLAKNAINSVLTQNDCEFEIIVSDNSTEEDQITDLKNFCDQINDSRIRYIKPGDSLSMTQHWDWAMSQGLKMSDASHITYLTDRMIFTLDSLRDLKKIAKHKPESIISYSYDAINDYGNPVLLYQLSWTGKVFEISSSHILKLASEVTDIYAIPRILNCIVPRTIINSIYNKYDNYFDSVSPDYNFAYRSLSIVDSIVYYDKSLLISYGATYSNGANILKGNMVKDATDFKKNLLVSKVAFETPVDMLLIHPNVILHEYYSVKSLTNSKKFPDINNKKYFSALVKFILSYENKKIKEELLQKLRKHLGISLLPIILKNNLKKNSGRIKFRLDNFFSTPNSTLLKIKTANIEKALDYAKNSPRQSSNDYENINIRTGKKPGLDKTVKILDVNDL